MKNNEYRSHSRKRTPWDDKTDLSPLEVFVRKEYKDHFEMHHDPNKLLKETELLNSYSPICCPYCGSAEFVKHGHYKTGAIRYLCKDCRKHFSITTGTIFQDHRLSIAEWIEFLLNLFGYTSINLNSKVNKNAATTTKYWLKKVFLLLEDYQEKILLEDTVWIDEFYYSVVRKDLKYKENGKLPRGLSRNKYCVGLGCDKNGHIIASVEGKAKTSVKKTLDVFQNHIKAGSELRHDSEHSHEKLVELLNLQSSVYPTKETKLLADKDNPMKEINHVCSALRSFLDSHPGFNRDELQDYLNLFVFMMSHPKNKLEKVNILLQMALTSRKILTFREYFSKKRQNIQ